MAKKYENIAADFSLRQIGRFCLHRCFFFYFLKVSRVKLWGFIQSQNQIILFQNGFFLVPLGIIEFMKLFLHAIPTKPFITLSLKIRRSTNFV